MKENVKFFAEYICIFYNHAITTSKFPSFLKMASITPTFKKGNKNKTENFRPVDILPVLLKTFKKLMSKQLPTSFENILSKFQCGFRKDYSTQHCLSLMLERWKVAVDNNEAFGALLTDHSKVFDSLSHDLLIAKLHSYGLSLTSLRLLSNYLSNRRQWIKVENALVNGKTLKLVYPKNQYLAHFYSAILFVICF